MKRKTKIQDWAQKEVARSQSWADGLHWIELHLDNSYVPKDEDIEPRGGQKDGKSKNKHDK